MDGQRRLSGSEWTFEHLSYIDGLCADLAAGYGLETYPNEMHVITSEQMLDAYSSIALPVHYAHWSFGKHFVTSAKSYIAGRQNLAYEIVLNSNPCIAYLMEQNSLAMQALVIAHASYGHNSFFKGNYLFRQWTQADAIVDYMLFARGYVADCEEKYGYARVESTLDALHALQYYGVDKYKRPSRLDSRRERIEQARRLDAARETMKQGEYYSLARPEQAERVVSRHFPEQPEENLLYFIEKHAPRLEPWQRELCRIVRKIATYFYPQRQLQLMNEGWATFWHHRLLNDLYDRDRIDDGILLEALHSHTNVIGQGAYGSINPYSLGFAIYTDLKRLCEAPTDEDREYLPGVAGRDWLATLHDAMANYRDESFLLQFLSPKVARDQRLMSITTRDSDDHWLVEATAGPESFDLLRSRLAASYRQEAMFPQISVVGFDREGSRALSLRHDVFEDKRLDPSQATAVLKYIKSLWHYDVRLESVDATGQRHAQFVEAT